MDRERLFDLLDQRRACPLVWISSPPGAGKTTLVASYLNARSLPNIWYQLDSGDHDLATFFYYLGLAAPPARKNSASSLLPLTPEYVHNIGGFARRYFRELFERMPRPSVLVLDNYQEVPGSSLTHSALREALEEIPDGVNVLIISRATPPIAFARFCAAQTLAQLQWRHLRLTSAEARALVASKVELSEQQVHLLYERSGGWAAGLILLLTHGTTGDAPASVAESQEAIFNYFAGEIFEKSPPEHQNALMRTAFLPRITPALAIRISGNDKTVGILENFHLRQYFTDRRNGGEVEYQYHALFRAFLLNVARQRLTSEAYATLAQTAADLLQEAGQAEEAIALNLELTQWGSAAQLLFTQARRLLGQGRGETLRAWIDAFPQQYVEEHPWLSYWRGTALIALKPLDARRDLERAYEGFMVAAETTGQALTLASIVQTFYFEANDFAPIDRWIPILENLLEQAPRFESTEDELAAFAGILMALLYRRPDHARLGEYLDRVISLSERVSDANQAANAAFFALTHTMFADNDHRRQRAVALGLETLDNDAVSPLNKALILHRLAFLASFSGDTRMARKYCELGLALAHRHKFTSAEVILVWALAQLAAVVGDETMASDLWDRVDALAPSQRAMDAVYLLWAKAALYSLRGDDTSALMLFEDGLATVDRLGLVTLKTSYRLPLALALVEAGRYDAASACLRDATEYIEAAGMRRFEACLRLIQAHCELLRGDVAACHETLRAGLTLARQSGSLMVAAGWRAKTLPLLWAEALKAGIEVDFVHRLIHHHNHPGPIDSEPWPWVIRIHTLGRFEVVVDGTPLAFTGRSPRQPLLLLKALVAHNGAASLQKLTEAVWPDAEADAAHLSLETALHRLRKLLRHDEVVVRQSNALQLDLRNCWVDALAFDNQVNQALPRFNVNGDEVRALQEQRNVLKLYRGDFLPQESNHPWVLSTRERLREKMLKLTLALGDALERQGQWEEAIAAYEQVLNHDNLSEPVYRRLMICHRQRGEVAEALKAYRRCRELLSIVLGVEPAPETQAIYRSLQ